MTIEQYKKEFASKGGKARVAGMTKKEHTALGRKAAAARWKKYKKAIDANR